MEYIYEGPVKLKVRFDPEKKVTFVCMGAKTRQGFAQVGSISHTSAHTSFID